MLQDLVSLFYPTCCCGCRTPLVSGEQLLCMSCVSRLPYTHQYLHRQNEITHQFGGLLPLKFAFAYLRYSKSGITQKLLHQLKYDGLQEIGEQLGRWFGHDLASQWKDQWEVIVPVPLHPTKLQIRGYNQSECFARGLSEPLRVPIAGDAVRRTVNNDSQTKKSKVLRWKNTTRVFEVGDRTSIQGKEVLLVDDVLTTGATLEACGHRVLEGGAASVSFCTIAWA